MIYYRINPYIAKSSSELSLNTEIISYLCLINLRQVGRDPADLEGQFEIGQFWGLFQGIIESWLTQMSQDFGKTALQIDNNENKYNSSHKVLFAMNLLIQWHN